MTLEWEIAFLIGYGNFEMVKESATSADERREMLRHFDESAKKELYNGRKPHGMWIRDQESERLDVVRIYGAVPNNVRAEHQRYSESRGE